VTVTVTVANAGPSAAVKTGTALLIPPGWTVARAGGGTVIGRQFITFTDASLAADGTITYTVTLTAPAAKGRALLAAAVASTVQRPRHPQQRHAHPHPGQLARRFTGLGLVAGDQAAGWPCQ
jgi:hypothetical protein